MAEMNSTKDVYVETAAFRRTLERTENNRQVVVTGPKKSGKSCLGHAILRHYHEKGFQPLIVKIFPELREHVSRSSMQVVLFDHVFGRDQLDSFETWLDSLPVECATEGKLKAIFTVNDCVFKQITQRHPTFTENFDTVDLFNMSQLLTDEEKKLILKMHWNQRNPSRPPLSHNDVHNILRQKYQTVMFPYDCAQYAANPDDKFPGDQEGVRCDMSGPNVTIHLSPAMRQGPNSDPCLLYEQYLPIHWQHDFLKKYDGELENHEISSANAQQSTTAHLHQQVEKFKQTELHSACRVGNVEKVKTLLSDGEDPDVGDCSNSTPLHVASYKGQEEVVRVLLSHNADKTATDIAGWSPLLLASLKGHTAIVELLLTHGKVSKAEENVSVDINFECCYEHKRLVQELRSCELAKTRKHAKKISLCRHCCDVKYRHLIENIQRHNQYVNKGTSCCKLTALYLASQGGHTAAVQVLLKHGACTDVIGDSDLEYYTWEETAAAENMKERETVSRPGYPERTVDGRKVGRSEPYRPEPNRWRYQWTALHPASSFGNVEVVQLLLKYFGSARQTTMHVACCTGQSKVVEMLRDYGIPTNVRDKDSNLPLHVACRARWVEKVRPSLRQSVTDRLTEIIKTLLKFNPKDVQKVGEDRKSPLSLACRHGSARMVHCLLEYGAEGDEPGLVMIACERGDAGILKVLLENKADIDEGNEASVLAGEDSPLYIACEEGFGEVVETLIAHGHRTDYKHESGWGTLLHIALLSTKLSRNIVEQLLQTKKIDVDAVNCRGDSPLHIACQKRLLNIMDLLLDAGASVDIQNSDGKTPLHLTWEHFFPDSEGDQVLCNMLEILLQRNSNPCKLANNGKCPLYKACGKVCRHRSGLEMLLLHMAEHNITTPSIQELSEKTQDTRGLQQIVPPAATALHVACQYSCEGVMDRVLGDNVNTTDENGTTPLLAAVKAKHHNVKIVRTLLENQAQVNSRDNQGVTVLQAYIDNTQRDSQVLELLLQHRVDLGQPDRKGNTLLHHADRLTDGEVDMIGASGLLTSDIVNAHTDDGDTPLHIACRANRLKAAEMLVTSGASVEIKNNREESPESIAKRYKICHLLGIFANQRKNPEEDDSLARSSATTTAAEAVDSNSTTTTAAVDNSSTNTTAGVDNSSSSTTNTATVDNSSTSTTNTAAVDNSSTNTTTAAVDNSSTSTTNTAAVDNSSTSTNTAAVDSTTTTTTAAADNSSTSTTAAVDNSSTNTTAGVNNSSTNTTTAAVDNSSTSTTTTAAVDISSITTTAAVDNSSTSTTAAVDISSITTTAAVDNSSTNTTAAVDKSSTTTTAAFDNSSTTTTTAAVDNSSTTTTTAAVDNSSTTSTAAVDDEDQAAEDHLLSTALQQSSTDNPTEHPQIPAVVRPEQDLNEAQFPLHMACRNGHDSVVLELLAGGKPTESLCGRNRTALHYASEGGHCVAVHYLLQHGARTETADNEGRTALHLACIGGHGSIATLLLKKGAEADACDHDGNTPLHLSAGEGHTHVCLVLVHHGARLDMINKEKQTAVDLVNEEHKDLKILLQKEQHRDGLKRKLLGQ